MFGGYEDTNLGSITPWRPLGGARIGISVGWLGCGTGHPADFPGDRRVADEYLARELAFKVLEAGTAPALGQAEAINRLLTRASLEHGALARPVRDLGRPEHGIG